MDQTKVIIVGASGHGKVILDVFEKTGTHQVLGFIDDNPAVPKETLSYPVLGTINEAPSLMATHHDCHFFIAIGDNWRRGIIRKQLEHLIPAIQWTSAIHPSAQIGKGVNIGKGTAILAGAVINSDARINDFTIVGSLACLDHDSQLGSYASLAPGSLTGGNVHIGAYTAVGIGAKISHGCHIGANSVVGAGSTVLQDFGEEWIIYGTPAQAMRKRAQGEKYL